MSFLGSIPDMSDLPGRVRNTPNSRHSISAHYANYGQDIGLVFLRQPRHNSGEILSEFPFSRNKRAHRDDLVSHFLTSKESIVIDIAFGWLGESRVNRTREEYMTIASRVPNLTALHEIVNDTLRKMAKAEYAPFEICYFKAGDRGHWYEKFPKSLSLETVRKAWLKSGMKELKAEHKKMQRLSRATG